MEQSKNQDKIALFGGTFDPVHAGHLEVAENAVRSLGLDRVIFLPCRQSPHKARAAGASEKERLAMLELATQDLAWAEVSAWEYDQPIPSYSWRTAEVFQHEYRSAQLYWLMGWDQWEVLPTWNRFDHLASLVSFIVHARDGVQGEFLQHRGATAEFVRGSHPASSSQIRATIAAEEQVPENWLGSAVEDFIAKQGLYRE